MADAEQMTALRTLPHDVVAVCERLDRIIELLDERNAIDRAMHAFMQAAAGAPPADPPQDRPLGMFSDYRETPDGNGWEVMVENAWHPATQGETFEIERRNASRRTRQRRR